MGSLENLTSLKHRQRQQAIEHPQQLFPGGTKILMTITRVRLELSLLKFIMTIRSYLHAMFILKTEMY